MSLDVSADDNKYTFDFVNDLKFYPESKFSTKMVVNNSMTSAGNAHSGSLEVTCSEGSKKLVWNASSDHYSCETGFTYTKHEQQVMTYKHKVLYSLTSKYSLFVFRYLQKN